MTVFLQLRVAGYTQYLSTEGGSKTGLVTYLDTSTAAITSLHTIMLLCHYSELHM